MRRNRNIYKENQERVMRRNKETGKSYEEKERKDFKEKQERVMRRKGETGF